MKELNYLTILLMILEISDNPPQLYFLIVDVDHMVK